MSDVAVGAETGKTWSDWFAVLDRAGAKRLEPRGIVALLGQRHGVGAWWQQMVTVTYEQARGLLEADEKPVAVEVSRSKTLAVPIARLWGAWQGAERARWLGRVTPTVRKVAVERLLRLTWDDGTSVDVLFSAKGAAKSQVSVRHGKLATARDAAERKAYWAEALDRLHAHLEG
jgi:hypothetical protein